MNDKLALCIGLNDYPGTSSDLSGCVNDANDWADALKDRGFSTTLLTDRKATGQALRTAIRDTIGRADRGDLVVITFSGHGSFVPDLDGDEPDGADECLCPYDVYSKGSITDDELFDLYSAKRSGVRLLMISDSCHSGTVAKFAPITTPPTAKGRKPPQRLVRFLPPETFESKSQIRKLGLHHARRSSSPPGRYGALLLSGCQDTEYSYDAWFQGRANGAFTFVALRELDKLPARATYRDWYRRIRDALPSQQYPQSPNLYGSSSMKSWEVFRAPWEPRTRSTAASSGRKASKKKDRTASKRKR